MKKVVAAGLASAVLFGTAVLATPSSATTVEDNAGCGVGTMIFKDKNEVIFQVLAATTNGTFGNQTFGMTSGTLECKRAAFVQNERLEKFVGANMDLLAADMATGSGETLSTLAELMEVDSTKKPEFFALLQSNFTKIFTSSDVQSSDVIDNIAKLIS